MSPPFLRSVRLAYLYLPSLCGSPEQMWYSASSHFLSASPGVSASVPSYRGAARSNKRTKRGRRSRLAHRPQVNVKCRAVSGCCVATSVVACPVLLTVRKWTPLRVGIGRNTVAVLPTSNLGNLFSPFTFLWTVLSVGAIYFLFIYIYTSLTVLLVFPVWFS